METSLKKFMKEECKISPEFCVVIVTVDENQLHFWDTIWYEKDPTKEEIDYELVEFKKERKDLPKEVRDNSKIICLPKDASKELLDSMDKITEENNEKTIICRRYR